MMSSLHSVLFVLVSLLVLIEFPVSSAELCSTYVGGCFAGRRTTSLAVTCADVCTEAECCVDTCSMPTLSGQYTATGACTGTIRAQGDCTLTCALGFYGTPTMTCPSAGAAMVIPSCNLNTCFLSATAGYTPATATSCAGATTITASACAMTCALGYHGVAQVACPLNSGAFTFSGCFINTCTLAAVNSGYSPISSTSCAGLITAGACGVTCAPGYFGNPTVSCNADGSTFTLGGCSVNTCTFAANAAYTAVGCTGAVPAGSCAVTCAPGYTGSPVVTCPTTNGNFGLSGCTASTCVYTNTTGYVPTNCGGNNIQAACSVACAPGYHGNAVATCSSGYFVLSGCSVNTCSLNFTMGYFATSCSGMIEASACTVRCMFGHSGTPSVKCLNHLGSFNLSNCTSAGVARASLSFTILTFILAIVLPMVSF